MVLHRYGKVLGCSQHMPGSFFFLSDSTPTLWDVRHGAAQNPESELCPKFWHPKNLSATLSTKNELRMKNLMVRA